MLTEPMLRKYLFQGAGISPAEFEAGATSAYNTVMPLIIQGSRSNALRHQLDPALLERVWAMQDSKVEGVLPFHSEALNARIKHANLIVGAFRAGFDPKHYSYRVEVGQHLHLVATKRELEAAGRPFMLYSGDAMRSIIGTRGLTGQFEVEFTCQEADIAGADESTGLLEPATQDSSGIGHLLECRQTSRRWLFESRFNGEFSNDPEWQIVDMDNLLNGNQFWAEVQSRRHDFL